MKFILLFLLSSICAFSQTTYNNLTVRTNLAVLSATSNRIAVFNGSNQVVSGTATPQQVNASAIQVPTVADMRALDPAQLNDGQLITTGGRNLSGDGGGATFRYVAGDTTTTNLGTVFSFLSGSGRLIWINDKMVNIRMFGATGDVVGSTFNTATNDSTAAIQACIDWAVPNGNAIFIPDGNYVVNTIAIDGATLRFESGQGPGYLGRRTAFWHRTVPPATDDMMTARNTANGRPTIFDGNFFMRPEQNRRAGYTILSATTSTFTLSTNDAVAAAASLTNASYNPTASFPHYGFVSFFNSNSNVRRYIGQGLVQSIDVNTGICTLFPGFSVQWVGQAGSDLTGGTVVFSQLNREVIGSLDTGWRPDPTRIGFSALDIQGRLSSVKLYNCQFHGGNCAIRYGLALDLICYNLYVTGCHFACIASAFVGSGSDIFLNGLTTLQGTYYRDVVSPSSGGGTASLSAETWTPSIALHDFRLTRSAIYGGAGSSDINNLVINYFVYPLWLEGGQQINIKSLTVDGTLRSTRLFGAANRVSIQNAKFRGALVNQGFQNILSSEAYLSLDPGSRIWIDNVSFENQTGTYSLGSGEVSGTLCKKTYGINVTSGASIQYDKNLTVTPGYSTNLYNPSSITARTTLDGSVTWSMGALTANTPVTTTVTIAGARVGDKVALGTTVLNGGTTLLSGAVTANDTVTLYATPLVNVGAQTPTILIKVLAQ